jgi:hypothetical protein
MGKLMKKSLLISHQVMNKKETNPRSIDSRRLYMDSNRLPEPGTVELKHISSKKASSNAHMSTLYSSELLMEVKF